MPPASLAWLRRREAADCQFYSMPLQEELLQRRCRLFRPFERRPVAALGDHAGARSRQPGADGAHPRGRRDRILVAGQQQRRAFDRRHVGWRGVGQRLAGARITLRILTHQHLPDQGNCNRLFAPGRGRGRGLDDGVGDRLHALGARRSGPSRAMLFTSLGFLSAMWKQTIVPMEWPAKLARPTPSAVTALATASAKSSNDRRALVGDRPDPGRSGRMTCICRPTPAITGVKVFEVPPSPWIMTSGSPWLSISMLIRSTKRVAISPTSLTSRRGCRT